MQTQVCEQRQILQCRWNGTSQSIPQQTQVSELRQQSQFRWNSTLRRP